MVYMTTTYAPTAEQQNAIDLATLGTDLVIEAGAGCAKSTTLELIARANPDRRYLYIAFNKAIVTEAETKFPQNVVCKTSHSIAFGAVGRTYAARLKSGRMRPFDIARLLGITKFVIELGDGKVKVLGPDRLAGLVMAAVRTFCQTADTDITVRHVPYIDGIDTPDADGKRTHAHNRAVAAHLAPALSKAWADIVNVHGTLPFTHDCYFKIWAMQNPVLRFDVVMVDEAQDTNPALLGVIAAQKCQRIIVGDSSQAIYEFRGAVDALGQFRKLGANVATLSTSFRFGQGIADVANDVLACLPTDLRLIGCPGKDSNVGSIVTPSIVLSRSNAAAVTGALDALGEGKRVAIVGGADEVVRFAEAAAKLIAGLPCTHPDLGCFDSWDEVVAYVANDELGADLKTMVDLIAKYGPDVIINGLGRTVPEDKADAVFSTAHRSKGRQWPHVRLAGDFPDPEKRPMSDEEFRLLYVAVTRAQVSLDVTMVAALNTDPAPAADTDPVPVTVDTTTGLANVSAVVDGHRVSFCCSTVADAAALLEAEHPGVQFAWPVNA